VEAAAAKANSAMSTATAEPRGWSGQAGSTRE
jgi:hypothetical protein